MKYDVHYQFAMFKNIILLFDIEEKLKNVSLSTVIYQKRFFSIYVQLFA